MYKYENLQKPFKEEKHFPYFKAGFRVRIRIVYGSLIRIRIRIGVSSGSGVRIKAKMRSFPGSEWSLGGLTCM
jgi:hypothetical protein